MNAATLTIAVKVAAVVGVIAGSGACAPAHVRLAQLPPDGAPLAERQAFFRQARPVVVRQADVSIGGPERRRSFMVLTDGTRVEHAGDLFAHVAQDSPAGLAAARAIEAEDRAGALALTGGLLSGVGAALMAPMLASTLLAPGSGGDVVNYAIAGAGLVGSLATLSGSGFLLFAQGSAAAAALERDAAFALYGDSLRQRLGLDADEVDGVTVPTQDERGVVVVRAPR